MNVVNTAEVTAENPNLSSQLCNTNSLSIFLV